MSLSTGIAHSHRASGESAMTKSFSSEAGRAALREDLDALARQLLLLGWTVRMPRMAADCPVGVLAVSARGFSPTELVQLDRHHRLSLITGEEALPVVDVTELARALRRRQATHAAGPPEALHA